MATLKRKNSDGTYSVVAQSGKTQTTSSAPKSYSNSVTSSGGKVTLTSKNASVNNVASKYETVSKKKSQANFNIRSLQPSASSTSASKTSGGFSSKRNPASYQETSSGRSRTETETFSPLKLAEGIVVKGADEFASGVTNTAAWLERNILEPFFPGITESTPIQDLSNYYRGVKESNQKYYAPNASAGGKLAEAVDQYGTMTAAAVPNAVLALMTGGGSAAASAGTKGLQALSSAASKAPGILSAVRSSASAMSRNPNFWSSFFQVTGNSYDSAIADGASEDAANLYALANGLLASGVEIGGGLETLPRNLRNNGDAVLSWINGMLEEGGEEVVQGAIERGLQNLVYGKNNDLVSWNNLSAVFNPVSASEEFLGGALVGGILGGGQIAAARGIDALSNRAAAQVQQQNDVQEIANTLGENGRKAFSSFYDQNADPVSYSDQFLRAYNAGLEGNAATTSPAADQTVSTAAYFAGQNDAEVRRTQLETDAEREAYYQAGLTGRALESVRVPGSRLTESQRTAAYEEGRTAGETSLADEIKSAGAAVNENAGLVSSSRANRLSQTDRDFLDAIAKKTGVSIEIAEPTGEGGANGWYQNGKIYIAQDAENSLDVVVKHEITHRLQELSPESYRAYRNYAVNALTERQGSSVNLIQRYKDLYAEHNVTLTTEQAMDEIAADFTETILQDRASIEKLVRQNRTVAQRFLDAVKDFLRNVKETLSGNRRAQDQAAAEAYGVTVDQLEEAARLWESLLTDADTKAAAEKSGSQTSETDLAYSIKGPDALRENAQLESERNALQRENARLRERMEYWKNQTRRTKVPTIDKKAVRKTARELIEESGATVLRDEISADLQTLYDSIAKDPDGKIGDTYPNAWAMSDAVSRKIIESAVETDNELYNAYADLRNFLKTTTIEISKSEAALIPDFNEWKRAQRGRMKVTAGESTNVDQVYQELSAMWPEFFDAERDVPPVDQLIRISEVLNSLYTITEYNPFERGGYLDNAVSRLSNEIMERFMELPQTKPTFADRQAAKISELRAQNRERIAQAVAQERSRRMKEVQSLKDRYAERDTARRERQTARSLRAKISRHASALSRKLLTPSDKANIPESLRGPVASALESINLESLYTVDPETGRRVKSQEGDPVKRTEAFLKLKEEYAKIAGSSDSQMIIDPALLGDAAEGFQGNFDKVISMRNIRLDEMSSDQLQTVWEVVRSLEHAIQTSGQILSKSKFTSTKAWAESIKRDTDTIRDRGGKTVRGLILDNETPYTFFSHYGNSGLSIYRMLRNAQDSQQIMTDQVAEQTAKIADEKTVKALNETTHEFTTERGDNLTLSTAQIMELALLMQRPQAAQHLMKGGIVQPEIKGTKIRRGTESILLSYQDLLDITNTLSQSELKIAQDLQKIMVTTLADLGNKASMEAYGYEKFLDEKYWPIRSAREGLRTDVEKGGQNTRSIKNIGMAQSVVPNASNPIELSGVFDTFSRHTADMVDYAAWLVPMEDINRLYNYKFKDGEGNPTGETIKGLLDKKGGYGSQQYWHRLMEDIQNGIAAVNDTTVAGAINRVIGNTKGAAVGANARVVIQQPTAFFRASSVLSPANLARGIKSGVTKGNGWKKALQYSAIAKRKNVGSFEISNPRHMNELLFGEKTNLAKMSDALSSPAAAADKITWGRLWNACEWTVKQRRPELQAGSPEFYKMVDQVFTDLIDQTQVVDGVLQRSQIMRSNNAINKQATSFMGEPTMALNMIYRAWDQYRYETDPVKRSAARKNFGRAAVALAVTNIVNAFAQSMIDGMRDDDKDKKYWDRVMTAFTGMTGEEETPWDAAYAAVITGNIGGNLNPVGMLPYARDALSLIQGYNVTRMDADVVGDLISAAQTMQDSLTGYKKKTLLYAAKELSNQVGKLFGVSAGNILRDVSGLVRSIAIETRNVPLMYQMEKTANNISSSSNKGRYMDLLFIALQQGDLDSYRQISSDLISAGVTDGAAIENSMRSKYKTAQGKDPSFTLPQESINAIGFREKLYTAPASEKSFSEADLTASQYQSFSAERSADYQSMSDQLKSSSLYRSLNDQGKEKAMGYAYDLSSERALEDASGGQYQTDTKWIQQADEANQAGIEDWQYVLWKAAYAMAETTRDANGDIVDGESKSDHVREWLNGFDNLTEDEKAYLWGTVYSSEWNRQIDSGSSNSGLWWK